MIWKLTRPLSVFLLVTLTVGCNGSAKQVTIEGHVSDADMIAATQKSPIQLTVQERPVRTPQYSVTEIHPDFGTDFKILDAKPDQSIDYKIAVATPSPGIDYKMHIVPAQGQLSYGISGLEVLLAPEVPPLGLKPEKLATE